MEDKAVVEEAEGKVKYQKILGVAFIILALVSFAVFGIAEIRDIVTTRQMQKLADQVEEGDTIVITVEDDKLSAKCEKGSKNK